MPDRRPLRRVASLLLFLAVWHAQALRFSEGIAVAAPSDALRALLRLAHTGAFWSALTSSAAHVMGGLLLALLVASPAAALCFYSRTAEFLMAPFLAFMKSVPIAAVAILLLILFSSGGIALAVVVVVAFPILCTALLTGARAADAKLVEMARVFRWSGLKQWRWLFLPAARPHLEGALRLSSGMAWKAGVAAEVIGVPPDSIGEALYRAKVFLATDELFAWAAVIMLLGAAAEQLSLLALSLFYRLLRMGDR